MTALTSSDTVIVCCIVFDNDWGLGWGAGGLFAVERGCVWCREAVLGGGVRGVDCWFGLESLRLDCHMCVLYFDRHRSVSEGGVA